ncbi:MAG: MOSC domain-containing protein [Planctomycetota bacterium]
MKVLSVNLSVVRSIEFEGRTIETGIYKEPVSDRVHVTAQGLEGDQQADLRVHGGEFKAVYGYGANSYAWWEEQLDRELPWGMFGENLTIADLDDNDVSVGDVFSIGDVKLEAVQPRMPCSKLAMRFNDPGIVKRFLDAARPGVYFRVLESGTVRVGDDCVAVHRESTRFSIPALAQLMYANPRDPELVQRALQLPALPPDLAKSLKE